MMIAPKNLLVLLLFACSPIISSAAPPVGPPPPTPPPPPGTPIDQYVLIAIVVAVVFGLSSIKKVNLKYK
jgi:hypothetical protein